jgi:Zn-finger nucleic acid-binding protein
LLNYGRRSGVIIDVCKKHGVWFDADELAHILDWVRSGGLAEAKRQEADETARQQRLAAIARANERDGPLTMELHQADVGAPGVVANLAALIASLFS